MLAPGGGIAQEFFRPRKVVVLAERRWGEAERAALLDGIQRFGVGRWREIGAAARGRRSRRRRLRPVASLPDRCAAPASARIAL
jgi:hypothetical protein